MITLIDSPNDRMKQETAAIRTDRVETKFRDKICQQSRTACSS